MEIKIFNGTEITLLLATTVTLFLPTITHIGGFGKCLDVLCTKIFKLWCSLKLLKFGKCLIQWYFPEMLSMPKIWNVKLDSFQCSESNSNWIRKQTFPCSVTATIILCNPNASRVKSTSLAWSGRCPSRPITVKMTLRIWRIWFEIRRSNVPNMSPVN